MTVTKKRQNAKEDPDEIEEDDDEVNDVIDKTVIENDNEPIIPRDENMYTFKKGDMKKLNDRVFLEDDNILYTLESPSKRHRGLPPIMVAIIGVIHRASRIADKKGKTFHGLTLFDCQAIFSPCHISNDTVRENIRKLWMNLRLLKRVNVQKTPKTVMQYFIINEEKFPCKDGTFLFGEDTHSSGTDFFGLICRNYPFCSLRPQNCEIVQILTKLREMLTPDYIRTMESRLNKSWIPVEVEINKIEKSIGAELKRVGDIPDVYVDELSDGEIRYFAEELYWAKPEGKYDAYLIRTRDRIKNKFDAITKDYIARHEMEEIKLIKVQKGEGIAEQLKKYVDSLTPDQWNALFMKVIEERATIKISKKKVPEHASAFDNIP